jgi:hypothetical protein
VAGDPDQKRNALLKPNARTLRANMNIIVHTLCYNEERLLPFFLDHYSVFASKIVVWDNYSSDRSIDIAHQHKRTKVEVNRFSTDNEFREDINVYIKNNCWKQDRADWVVVCDVDEFLYAANLRAFLQGRRHVHVFKPRGYNMVSEQFPDYGRPLTEQVKFGAVAENYSKTVLFNPGALTEIGFGPGSHTSSPHRNGIVMSYDARNFGDDLKLLHYKNISFDYRFKKNAEYAARVGPISRQQNWSFHLGYDEEKQRAEFDALLNSATQVLP